MWFKLKEFGIGKCKQKPQISFELNFLNDFFANTSVDITGASNRATELQS